MRGGFAAERRADGEVRGLCVAARQRRNMVKYGQVKYRIFISSVQREFTKERKTLAEYVRKDAILGRHRSIPVNPLLAQGMYLRGYIEHVGSGTGDIIEKCRESGLPPPRWESEDDGLTIILRRATIVSQPQTDRETTSETTLETTPETTL